jgi:hypothetical protein
METEPKFISNINVVSYEHSKLQESVVLDSGRYVNIKAVN